MSQQPEALRLADALKYGTPFISGVSTIDQSEKELRRLHAENEALKASQIDVKSAMLQAAAMEREACALLCDNLQDVPATEPRHCAQDIRARGGHTMTTPKGTEQPAEGLYTRTMHGTRARYTLAYSHVNDYHIVDAMKVNTFRLVHAYGEGGRRYHYDVTPDTAAFIAAASIAEKAMVDAMMEANQVQPAHTLEKYTEKQLAAINQARDIMQSAGVFVTHWKHPGMHDIVKAGIDAVRKYEEMK